MLPAKGPTRTVPGPRAHPQSPEVAGSSPVGGPAPHTHHPQAHPHIRSHTRTGPAPHTHHPQAHARTHPQAHPHIRSHTRTSGNTKTPEPEAVPGSCGGGWGIRTPEGLHPTRFPSVRHRPLGESSVHIVPDNHKQETPLSANPSQWSRSQMGVQAFTRRR